jgi:hypothetical protein
MWCSSVQCAELCTGWAQQTHTHIYKHTMYVQIYNEKTLNHSWIRLNVQQLFHLVSLNLLKPTDYGMHQQVEHYNNCTLCPHYIYLFCICLRTNSDLCHLHKKRIVFITEMKSVYNAVRTGPLNEAVCNPSFKG